MKAKFVVGYLVLVALLDYMGLGMVVTIFPHLLLDNHSHVLPLLWTHGERLVALGIFLAIYPLGQFFGAIVLGKLSDCYGRKKMMTISLLGTLVGFLLSAVSVVIASGVMLFVSRLFAGLFAGNVAIAQASMADISNETTKTRNLTLIQIALGLAWVFGPPLGGLLSVFSIGTMSGFATPFLFISLLLIMLLLYTIFIYQETLINKKKEKINVLSGFQQISLAYVNQAYRYAFIVWFMFVSGWWLFEAFLPAYLLQVFHFNPVQIGSFLASMGATYALFQYLVVQRFARKSTPEKMVKYSLIISGISVLFISVVQNTIELHIAITLFVTSMGFALPGLITCISNLASKNDQGHVMGMITSVQAIATVLMMLIGGFLDNRFITVTVIGGGLLLILSWGLFLFGFKQKIFSGVNQKQIAG